MDRGRLERFLNERWYGQRRPGPLLRALTPVYRLLAGRRWRRPEVRAPLPVIVVGNITAGGSGKTPVVAALAATLTAAGERPAIISRGYGGSARGAPIRVATDDPVDAVGDEPLLLARRAGCPVWVARDRSAALAAAIEAGASVVLADDGLQHPRLPRSFEICVIDGLRGLGNGQLLPAGPLRQPLDRLETVDRVVVKQPLSAPLPQVPCESFGMTPGAPYALGADEPLPERAQTTFDAVCAIGNPESFFGLLERLAFRFKRHAFADHHAYSAADLEGLGPLLVTEKDAVKLESLEHRPPTWVLPVKAELPESLREAVIGHVREFRQHG